LAFQIGSAHLQIGPGHLERCHDPLCFADPQRLCNGPVACLRPAVWQIRAVVDAPRRRRTRRPLI
jgi:hypothetical protein